MTPSLDPSATADARPTLVPESPEIRGDMPKRLQFSLAGLLLLTTLFAVSMGLLKLYGYWGLVLIIGALILYMFWHPHWSQYPLTCFTIDFLWGILLPGLCIVYDPGLLSADEFQPFNSAIVALVLWQMALLAIWLVAGPQGHSWNGFLSGSLSVGVFVAGFIALPMFFLACASIWCYGAGLPCLVPVMTTWVFARNSNSVCSCKGAAGLARRQYEMAYKAGFFAAIVIPATIASCIYGLGGPFPFPKLAIETLNRTM